MAISTFFALPDEKIASKYSISNSVQVLTLLNIMTSSTNPYSINHRSTIFGQQKWHKEILTTQVIF